MRVIILISLALLVISGCQQAQEGHVCTEAEKAAEVCTMEYNPVCGDNGKTYSNPCQACSSGEIDSWTEGEC